MDFQKLRKEYEQAGLDESKLVDDPIKQLELWVQEAADHSPGRWAEANAMTLATADSSGHVTARMVLLKGIEPTGIRFFTNYDSCKGQQLADNARAAVVFHWGYLGRQIRLEGTVTKTSRDVSEEYFHSRPRGSQLGAAISRQSHEVESREALDQEKQKLAAELGDSPVPLPENWGGYLITADQIEFWQGRLDRLHDRIVYQLQSGNSWQRVRLSP